MASATDRHWAKGNLLGSLVVPQRAKVSPTLRADVRLGAKASLGSRLSFALGRMHASMFRQMFAPGRKGVKVQGGCSPLGDGFNCAWLCFSPLSDLFSLLLIAVLPHFNNSVRHSFRHAFGVAQTVVGVGIDEGR